MKTEDTNEGKKVALVAILGVTPAVLTEAVWALAHPKDGDPVIPDEVLVLTTGTGEAHLKKTLGVHVTRGGIWNALKKDLVAEGHDLSGKLVVKVELFKDREGRLLEDLPTEEANLQAADKMMKELRDYTDDEGWIVYGLLAGGRKTMSALFFSCMCLLGRQGDRIYHVLVSEGYDARLEPTFCYPQKGVVHDDGKGRKLPSENAEVNLFSVPFAPMGEWCLQKCRGRRLSYSGLIAAVRHTMTEALIPQIEIDVRGEGRVRVGELELKGNWVPLMVCLCQGEKTVRVVVEKLWKLQNKLHELRDDDIPFAYESVATRGDAKVVRMSERRGTGFRDMSQHWWLDDFCTGGRYFLKKDKSMNQLVSDLKSKYMNKDKFNLSQTLKKRYPCLCEQLFEGQVDKCQVKWTGVEQLHSIIREILFPEGLPVISA